MQRLLPLLIISCFSCFTFASEDGTAILKKIDELYRSDSSIATMKMTIVTPNWQRTMEMESWTKGMEETFFRVLSPKKTEAFLP